MNRLLEGKSAIVTGGAAGIGRIAAKVFAESGALVVVSDVDDAGGQETVDLLHSAGHSAIFVHCDVSDEDQVVDLISRTTAEFGRLDCAFNNAGISGGQQHVHETDLDTWSRTLAINLTGTFLCVKHEIRTFLRQGGGGAIVNASSTSSVMGVPLTAAYGAAKSGINQLVRTAAAEYAEHNIRINAVVPGPISTDLVARACEENPALEKKLLGSVPMGRFGTPTDVANYAAFLCSDNASFVTGTLATIDGGKSMA